MVAAAAAGAVAVAVRAVVEAVAVVLVAGVSPWVVLVAVASVAATAGVFLLVALLLATTARSRDTSRTPARAQENATIAVSQVIWPQIVAVVVLRAVVLRVAVAVVGRAVDVSPAGAGGRPCPVRAVAPATVDVARATVGEDVDEGRTA